MSTPTIIKGIILPDTHCPDYDKKAMNATLQYIIDIRPDYLLHLGDLCDFASLSRFRVASSSELTGLKTEIDETNKWLDAIDTILSDKCKKVITLGNHDQRPEIYRLNNWDAAARKLLGLDVLPNAEEMFRLKKRGWKVLERGALFSLGKALFTHGYFVNKYHAQKTVSKFFKNIYYGHTHDCQSHTMVGLDSLPVEAMSLGTLQNKNPKWMQGVPTPWVHMVSTIYVFDGGKYNLYPSKIINGRFVSPEGKLYVG